MDRKGVSVVSHPKSSLHATTQEENNTNNNSNEEEQYQKYSEVSYSSESSQGIATSQTADHYRNNSTYSLAMTQKKYTLDDEEIKVDMDQDNYLQEGEFIVQSQSFSLLPMTEQYHNFTFDNTEKKINSVYVPTEVVDQIFAFSFARKGQFNYLQISKQLMKHASIEKLPKKEFNEACQQICMQVVIQLEEYIMDETKAYPLPLNLYRIPFLKRALTKAQTILDKSQFRTFIIFVKKTFDLQDVAIDQGEAISLYKKILKLAEKIAIYKQNLTAKQKQQRQPQVPKLNPKDQMKLKQGLNVFRWEKKNTVHQLNKIWKEEHNLLLRRLWKKNGMLTNIRQEFIRRYPEHADVWTQKNLRLRFNKMIREGIRMFESSPLKKYTILPSSLKMDDAMSQLIAGYSSGAQTRQLLLTFMDNSQDLELFGRLQRSIVKITQSEKYQTVKKQMKDRTRSQII